jgi:uncharacterized Zn-binding protein involved in type VI secretion
MYPAATRGSKTGHGPPLDGKGSSKVIINGQAAWRAKIDFHRCPLTSPDPHIGGIVRKGSKKVIINGYAMARVGDIIKEAAGPPNIIQKGSRAVVIE